MERLTDMWHAVRSKGDAGQRPGMQPRSGPRALSQQARRRQYQRMDALGRRCRKNAAKRRSEALERDDEERDQPRSFLAYRFRFRMAVRPQNGSTRAGATR